MKDELKDKAQCNYEYMTNEEYRVELQKIFDNIEENYILRWFYRFVTEKLKGSKM